MLSQLPMINFHFNQMMAYRTSAYKFNLCESFECHLRRYQHHRRLQREAKLARYEASNSKNQDKIASEFIEAFCGSDMFRKNAILNHFSSNANRRIPSLNTNSFLRGDAFLFNFAPQLPSQNSLNQQIHRRAFHSNERNRHQQRARSSDRSPSILKTLFSTFAKLPFFSSVSSLASSPSPSSASAATSPSSASLQQLMKRIDSLPSNSNGATFTQSEGGSGGAPLSHSQMKQIAMDAYLLGADKDASDNQTKENRHRAYDIFRGVFYLALLYYLYTIIRDDVEISFESSYSKSNNTGGGNKRNTPNVSDEDNEASGKPAAATPSLPNLGHAGGERDSYIVHDVNESLDDVKGCDEVKSELVDIVDFLNDPKKYTRLGAKLPKGVLLHGPPGVGKTLLARAVSGEAGVPFLYANGSQFEEKFVGVGAQRMRKLFKEARDHAPCIVFIDEIDTVGRNRTNSPFHPYANQTINQLLTELDGFETGGQSGSGAGIIVMAATNQAPVLDKALTRPGRFDRLINVSPPDFKGRRDLYAHYLAKVRVVEEAAAATISPSPAGTIAAAAPPDLDKLAVASVGKTGAQIRNHVNQAAIMAVLSGARAVSQAHLEDALSKIEMGPSRALPSNSSENRMTAVHEAGHALIAFLHSASGGGAGSVQDDVNIRLSSVTILPRGQSLGHTLAPQNKDAAYHTELELRARIELALGGRAAEELVFGRDHVTTGCVGDYMNMNGLASMLVQQMGVASGVGLEVSAGGGGGAATCSCGATQSVSREQNAQIDAAIRKLLAECYENVKRRLHERRADLDRLVEALLEHHTLKEEDVRAVLANQKPPVAIRAETAATNQKAKQREWGFRKSARSDASSMTKEQNNRGSVAGGGGGKVERSASGEAAGGMWDRLWGNLVADMSKNEASSASSSSASSLSSSSDEFSSKNDDADKTSSANSDTKKRSKNEEA